MRHVSGRDKVSELADRMQPHLEYAPDMNTLSVWWDARRAQKQGPAAIAERQRTRLAEIIAYARANSPYYGELYKGLPERIEDATLLPVTSKKELMARFDDWATDRAITLVRAREFIDDPQRIGDQFLGKYTALTTSGTTGTRGIFVLDERSMSVTNAIAARMLSAWLGFADAFKILAGRGRMAMVMATDGHFASAVAAARLRKRRGKRMLTLSVHTPLPELVERLNEFRPVLLAPYASMSAMLAREQEAGRLQIHPALIALSAEGLPTNEYERIGRAFQSKVGNSYAATECPFLSYACREGWLHVNADWVIAEPVDAEFRPTPPGEQSHAVLITNLANRVQPILRYDLGDSVVQRPDPCPCGNSLPAIRVQGRTADLLTFPGVGGEKISIPPLALEVDDVPGVELFQIIQNAPTSLRVRLRTAANADADNVWEAVHGRIRQLLNAHKLEQVTVERADEPPEQSPGGKYRTVIPLK
jgi:phenylacetate-coenzyme A ligase PaaK-like adenylate-forming protein